jgi:endonuclease/exonuclease/phosphatase family metal-dependent hydrolase
VKSRIADVVGTVPVVVVLVAVIVGVFVVARDHSPSPQSTALPPISSASTTSAPSATPQASPEETHSPAESGSPRPSHAVEPTPALPTATATVCVNRTKHRQLSVVTFNIHSARAENGSVQLDTIAAELARWAPDVVLLQEVDRGRAWSGRIDMPAVLADRLDMTWAFGANVVRSPTNQYGTAILSRFPIESFRNTALPAPRGTQQRGLLHAIIDVRGVPVSVYDTHLENTSGTARLQQIRAIVPVVRADPRPRLLGGDLNSSPASSVLDIARSVLADTWTSVGAGPSMTAPAGNPRVRIDYLLYADGAGVTLTPERMERLPSAVSDHFAVRADYGVAAEGDEVCVPQVSLPPGE